MSVERPPAFHAAVAIIDNYMHVGEFKLFENEVVPFAKSSDEFWWYLLLCSVPFTSMYARDGGDQPLISEPSVNASQSPREECLLRKSNLEKTGFDMEFICNDAAAEPQVDVVQINPTTNFLDKLAYSHIKLPRHKFMHYIASNKLVKRPADVPKFLGYNMAVYSNGDAKCMDLHSKGKDKLRNQPATLLTIDKQTLVHACPLYGKAFVMAEDMDLAPAEVREVVIFCMGQSEALEYKLTSWDKLREALQEDARKFAMSSEHIRRRR